MDNYSLNFHQTFSPDLEYVGRILSIADNCIELSKEEISEMTGIPTGKGSGKVEPHIYYCKYMGLINLSKKSSKYTLTKTSLGKCVSNEDPYMQEELTKLLCNYFLTSQTLGADMWSYIFRILPTYLGNSINSKSITEECKKRYNKSPNLSAFNSTYNNQNSLECLNLLRIESSKIDGTNISIYNFKLHKYNPDYFYVYLYTLLSDLEYKYELNRLEFTIDEIIKGIYWGRGYNFNYEQVLEMLDRFKSKGVIGINRQLNPITIIKKVNSNDIISKLYSLLL